MFTSNGQVHHHWTPVEFRETTKLRQLSEHLLVVVETDPLPIQITNGLLHRRPLRGARQRRGTSTRERACRLPRRLGRTERPQCRTDPRGVDGRRRRSARPMSSQSRSVEPSLLGCRASSSRATAGMAIHTCHANAMSIRHPNCTSDPTSLKGPDRHRRIARQVEVPSFRDRRARRVLRQRARLPHDCAARTLTSTIRTSPSARSTTAASA